MLELFPEGLTFLGVELSVEDHYTITHKSDSELLRIFNIERDRPVYPSYFKDIRKKVRDEIYKWDGVMFHKCYICTCGNRYEPYDCKLCGAIDVYPLCRTCHNRKHHKKFAKYKKKMVKTTPQT